MKKGRILLAVGFVVAALSVSAQDYAFKVLANKGANEYKSGEGWQAIKTGTTLKKDDELKLGENSYLALVHSSGKPLELKQAGPHKVADLAASMKPGASVLNKYTDFILSSNSAEAKKNRLSATGAVHRGTADQLPLFLPPAQNASIFGKSMVVEWEVPKSGGPYVVTIKNIFEDELVKYETPETHQRIDLSDPKLASETAFLIEVSSKSDSKVKSESKVVKRLSAADGERIKKAFMEIAGDLKDQSALDRYIQAGFYEQNGLLIDALTSYEDAIKMAPDVDAYREARDEFLYRNKLATPKP
ncbi:MAG: hypothetical protein U0289_14895 [Cyclobacteriaceae bacterium]|jgi:hypothetical protein|nr:hypothetical protein [Cytophagales bacterium]HNP75701.1 hypothetical protein [Cyclobacteriaceae bacterium]HQQ82638.1 hypothetical protein [Cyclobacteriaceae bacterium]